MKKSRKIMFYIFFNIILIIIVSLIILIRLHQTNVKQSQKITYVEEIEGDDELRVVDNRNYYYVVNDCINKFYSYYMTLFNVTQYYNDINDQSEIEEIEMHSADIIYNMLDQEYIQTKGITANNIKTNLHEIKKAVVDITEMYVSEKTSNINVYVVKGILAEESTNNVNEFQIIVKLDFANKTFSIIPQEYVKEKYNNLSAGDEIKINTSDSIEANKNNRFNYTYVSNDIYVKDLFSKLKNEIRYSMNLVYDDLDTEYKEKKFSSLNEFQSYIKENSSKYLNMQLDSYQRTTMDNYVRYVLVDTKGNYYIFHETAPMQYTVILDTYTIDIPEFTEKYEAANVQEKMLLNLNKFMLAINDKDYKYAYNVLADSFKANNFPTLDSFESYAKSNFFDANKFDYLEFGSEAETYYTYKVKITDETNNSTSILNKTFIMQLGEGTEFKLSFNLE